jgi:hypothetical protein
MSSVTKKELSEIINTGSRGNKTKAYHTLRKTKTQKNNSSKAE